MSSKVYYKQQASKHVKAEEDARKEQPWKLRVEEI